MPVAVAIAVGSNPLGSYAAGRQSAQRVLPAGEFDLEAHLRASSFGGQAAPLRVLDFVRAARDPDDQDLLAATPVRLTGFVTADEEGDGTTFFLTRFTIGCCAADALAVLVRVDLPEDDELPTPDEWIAVEGTLAREDPPADSLAAPRLTATRITPTDRPSEVYEYPP